MAKIGNLVFRIRDPRDDFAGVELPELTVNEVADEIERRSPSVSLSINSYEFSGSISLLTADLVDSIVPGTEMARRARKEAEFAFDVVDEVKARMDHKQAAQNRRDTNDPRIRALDALLTTPQGEVVVHAFLEVMRERADTMDHYYPSSQIARRTREYLRSIEEDVALAYKQPSLVQRPQFVVDLRNALTQSQERLNNPETPVRSERLRSEFTQALNRLAEWM